ncbi:MGH1-like glycoside hydrolase domain-containing protein [Methylomonas rhizoryzae]|uniref:MGH1-like glycoside hydrolase domain-containing protein n=1 Tax=Methylomonas rhizoryzae TaxID=2608981 RepID=UPI001680ED85|nr:glucosidase [Methylomonas rhizoryzae]
MVNNAEQHRLEQQRQGRENWRLWGPYLAERAWGTVREDYSADGNAWQYFSHDQARSRAYRWNEDGLGGICDQNQHLCFGLALWNGRDPILKERAFGLTGNEGNRGEDVKEYYFYKDAVPSHSYLHYLYKYPQAAYPYARLIEENARRGREQAPFSLLDSGVFADDCYWDVQVEYAKLSPDDLLIRITVANRGAQQATLQVLPTLWFRNTWSWGEADSAKPLLQLESAGDSAWSVKAEHARLGAYRLYGESADEWLFSENDSNHQRLWGGTNASPYVKDAFHRYLIEGDGAAVNPAATGTKFAARYSVTLAGRSETCIVLRLSAQAQEKPLNDAAAVFGLRRREADLFYAGLLADAEADDRRIFRQAMAGMIWSKQYFHFDVLRWLRGDGNTQPPHSRKSGRNARWLHLRAGDVISMPDKWEYPWFAAWDLAFHCIAFSAIDVDFAKDQLELLLKENYLHPNGQIPAYEWAFGDVNPPVQALAALQVFRAERRQRGQGDRNFLQRVFHKLLMNYVWWINSKDGDGLNVFEGGFLGLDNISVFDRSMSLPPGFRLKQADATGWMAMFALNMTLIALELAIDDPDYEDSAIQTYEQFLHIADSIAGNACSGVSLWDAADGFFKDLLVEPNGCYHRVDVFSWVGLIPLFACEIVDQRLLANVPRFRQLLDDHEGGEFHGNFICACPAHENAAGERLLALVDHTMLPAIVRRLFDPAEFLSPYGIRSLSRRHAERRDLGVLPGVGRALIDYVPGESNSGLFGGNSNWRGPVWLPTNYALILALEKFNRFLGEEYKVAAPGLADADLSLRQVIDGLARCMTNLYRPDADGRLPAFPADSPWQFDPLWREHLLFFEYFHGDNGLGLGAAHQTGWTGLLANLLMRCHDADIAGFEVGRELQLGACQGRQYAQSVDTAA